MIYEDFLFSQLLRDTIEEYNTLAYDELYEISKDLYNNSFYKSDFNKTHINLYECIKILYLQKRII